MPLLNFFPALETIGNKSNFENVLMEFTVTASDDDLGDNLALWTTTPPPLPLGATFTQLPGSRIGTFSWTPGFDQSGNYEIGFCVSDDGDPIEVDCELITVTIGNVNRTPVFDPVPPLEVQEYDMIEFIVTATDPDGDYVVLSTGSLPDGADFNAANGVFTWIPNYDQAGINIVSFLATDNGYPIETGQLEVVMTGNDIPPTALND